MPTRNVSQLLWVAKAAANSGASGWSVLAASGSGIVRLARFYAAPRVAAGELVPVLEPLWPRVSVFAVHTSVSPAPTKIRAFIDLARQAAARVLDPE